MDRLVLTMTVEELQQAGDTWNQVHISTVTSKRNSMESLNIAEYDLEGVKDKICTMMEVVIPLFVTTVLKGIVNPMMHSKCMNVVV